MRLLIDENVPLKLAVELLRLYPNSIYVLNSHLKGKSDKYLFEYAKKNGFIIITYDTDFLDMLCYPLENSPGRIILRYKNLKISETLEKTVKALEILKNKDLNNSIVIVSNDKIRIKRYNL